MKCTIDFRDICFSDYVPDHRWIGVFVTAETVVGDMLTDLGDEAGQDGFTPSGDEWTEAHTEAFNAAMSAYRALWEDDINAQLGTLTVGKYLETEYEHESPCAWFTVTFESED